MHPLDVELIREVRRELAKRPFDITRLEVIVEKGRVSLGGQINNLRDQPLVDLRDEFDIFQKSILRNARAKELIVTVRFLQAEGREEHHDPRGRRRQ
ncbi:MAG: BON domain-containing protein [Capsulimonadaceae bacterium]